MWDYDKRRGYAEQPDSYDRLINAAMRVDEVTFVTLNYDDLFDRRLFVSPSTSSPDSPACYSIYRSRSDSAMRSD
jgi:hypothetical protein